MGGGCGRVAGPPEEVGVDDVRNCVAAENRTQLSFAQQGCVNMLCSLLTVSVNPVAAVPLSSVVSEPTAAPLEGLGFLVFACQAATACTVSV